MVTFAFVLELVVLVEAVGFVGLALPPAGLLLVVLNLAVQTGLVGLGPEIGFEKFVDFG